MSDYEAYSLDEIALLPATTSRIEHRNDTNPFIDDKLPVFVSPMTCLINEANIKTFQESSIIPIYPVNKSTFADRLKVCGAGNWIAVTLSEFNNLFTQGNFPKDIKMSVLIDVANGHMKTLFDSVKKAKDIYGEKLTVMIGNIANPDTYIECCNANVDYVRIGIGGGSGCTTSVQTGIHSSIPYILNRIKEIKQIPSLSDRIPKEFNTKIIADGGINTISKAVKALALGADFVMMGKYFAGCNDIVLSNVYYPNGKQENIYYGQASKRGQLDRFGEVRNFPEGTEIRVPAEYSFKEAIHAIEASLRSAMSYCNACSLDDFIGKVKYIIQTPLEFNNYNK